MRRIIKDITGYEPTRTGFILFFVLLIYFHENGNELKALMIAVVLTFIFELISNFIDKTEKFLNDPFKEKEKQ